MILQTSKFFLHVKKLWLHNKILIMELKTYARKHKLFQIYYNLKKEEHNNMHYSDINNLNIHVGRVTSTLTICYLLWIRN